MHDDREKFVKVLGDTLLKYLRLESRELGGGLHLRIDLMGDVALLELTDGHGVSEVWVVADGGFVRQGELASKRETLTRPPRAFFFDARSTILEGDRLIVVFPEPASGDGDQDRG